MKYNQWVEEGKIGVVRNALKSIIGEESPDSLCLYITFRTQDRDVQILPFLKAQYPEEITISLSSDEFWNLTVTEDHFSVELSFDTQRQRIKVPFRSLVNFIDPIAEFALQFEKLEEDLPQNENVIFINKFRSPSEG
jgi:hypothetical protein